MIPVKKFNPQNGQVALLMALVFQVFFIFFAMVVNVGLLVFHKINLQNSVDLAAYYASMKQAEVLNVIAHNNYQIKQAWKLLSFRYRAFGMAGDETGANLPLYCIGSYGPNVNGNGCRSNNPNQISNNEHEPFNPLCSISFCSSYQAWADMENTENYCGMNCQARNIPLPGRPVQGAGGNPFTGSLANLVRAVQNLTNETIVGSQNKCLQSMKNSWMLLGTYIFTYKWDVLNRKQIINTLANHISLDEGNLLDIEGQSVREGALKTFYKNLTLPNREKIDPLTGNGEGASFKLYNSLAHPNCRATGTDYRRPPQWLTPIFVRPHFRYVDAQCTGQTSLNRNYYWFHESFSNPNSGADGTQQVRSQEPELFQFIQQVAFEPSEFSTPESIHQASIVGYEKDPWCQAYIKIEAQVTPQIPFAPLGQITLKATAYAKPFGGSIGPWDGRSWSPSDRQSSRSNTPLEQRIDTHLTLRADPQVNESIQEILNRFNSDPQNPERVKEVDTLLPGYSRFVGDSSGLRAVGTMATWFDGIYRLSLSGSPDSKLNQRYWIPALSKITETGDPLSWNEQSPSSPPPSRKLEIESILPDQFDLTYYSIELNYSDNYITKLRQNPQILSLASSQGLPPEVIVRGDLGYRSTQENLRRFSIKDQLLLANESPWLIRESRTMPSGFQIPGLGYIMKPSEPHSLLTSWHIRKPGDYRINNERFGKCLSPVTTRAGSSPEQEATPGDCVAGGRSGYSVKLVNPQFLKEPQNLGNTASAPIRNPPPD